LLIINVVLLLICINFSRFIVGQGKIDVGKGTGGPPLAVLCTFYSQRVSIALQRVQVNTILRHAIFIGESSSRLTVFRVFYPFKLCLL
jgi:ABC-type methionine transport system permease subunit